MPLPLWLAMVALELAALVGTASLFLAARGPARALLTRLGPRLAVTNPPRSDPSRSNHPVPTRPVPTHPVPTRASAEPRCLGPQPGG